MADRWHDRLARMDRRIDRQIAETVRVLPMVRGDLSVRPDVDRPPFDLVGLLFVGNDDDDIGGRESRMFRERMLTGPARLEVTLEQLAGRVVRKGDRIEATHQGRAYVVETIDPIPGRIKITLSLAA